MRQNRGLYAESRMLKEGKGPVRSKRQLTGKLAKAHGRGKLISGKDGRLIRKDSLSS